MLIIGAVTFMLSFERGFIESAATPSLSGVVVVFCLRCRVAHGGAKPGRKRKSDESESGEHDRHATNCYDRW